MHYVEKIRNATASAPPPVRIYRRLEIVDGREVWKYSNVRTPGAEPVNSASRR
jgi:hypothetical protein